MDIPDYAAEALSDALNNLKDLPTHEAAQRATEMVNGLMEVMALNTDKRSYGVCCSVLDLLFNDAVTQGNLLASRERWTHLDDDDKRNVWFSMQMQIQGVMKIMQDMLVLLQEGK
jgi:hypothetical protein